MFTCLCPLRVALAVCPDSLCDCLGSAGTFSTVASTKVKVAIAKVSSSGSAYKIPAQIVGDTCAAEGQFAGDAEAPVETDSLLLLAPAPDKAVKFKAKKFYGILEPGVFVHGDVGTAGGSVLNAEAAVIDGVIDVTGTLPAVARCQQAQLDLATAASTLGGLTPTMSLGSVQAKGGGDAPTIITAPPGVTVATADSIQVKAAKVDGYPEGSEIDIEMDSATEAFIINTPTLKVGKFCTITATDPTKVIINVVGPGGRVGIDANAVIDVAVLAKDRKITAGADAITGNLYGIGVQVKGANVASTLACSPSGAFIDPDPTSVDHQRGR
jgi:hypothetical protein